MSYLLISNRKLALRLLVVLRERLQLLDWFRLRHRHAELDVLFRIFVAGLQHVSIPLSHKTHPLSHIDFGIIR